MAKPLSSVVKIIKPVADGLGIGGLARQGYVEMRLLGERAKFMVSGRPYPHTAILLAGSGRSGTTWITDLLCAFPGIQQIFEPLLPLWNSTVREITGWGNTDPHLRSIYLRQSGDYAAWDRLWQQILTGRYRNYWTDYERNCYFPDRFLIKEIRANLMLAYLYKQFCPHIIYIVRHPCAVVQSRLAVKWHADVQDILVQDALVADYLSPWVAKIEKERDLLGAHAVWWAVENLVALKELKHIPHHFVEYEAMLLQPDTEARRLFDWLNWKFDPEHISSAVSTESRMSRQNVSYQSAGARLNSWRTGLSEEQQKKILWWAHEMGIPNYTEALLPRDLQPIYAQIV
jgi:hypothetical protein